MAINKKTKAYVLETLDRIAGHCQVLDRKLDEHVSLDQLDDIYEELLAMRAAANDAIAAVQLAVQAKPKRKKEKL